MRFRNLMANGLIPGVTGAGRIVTDTKFPDFDLTQLMILIRTGNLF